jgi:hypothetical protein
MRVRSKALAITGSVAAMGLATLGLAAVNHPVKAKGLKIDMATHYTTCGASNDTQGTNPPLPACHPAVQTSATNGTHVLTYGIKGAANVQVAVATGDIKLKVKSADIHDSASPNPTGVIADGQQLGLHVDHAVSTAVTGCGSGDPNGCSTIDLGPLFNGQFKASCLAGKCTLNSTVNTLLGSQTISAGQAVNIQISGVGINDQDGDEAFSEGLFIP